MPPELEAARLDYQGGFDSNRDMQSEHHKNSATDNSQALPARRNGPSSDVDSPCNEQGAEVTSLPAPWVSTLSTVPSSYHYFRSSSGLYRSFSLPTRGRYTSSPITMAVDQRGSLRAQLSREQLTTFEDIPLHDLPLCNAAPPTTPQRTLRSSVRRMSRRLSLTPSEMPYPKPVLYKHNDEDKAEKLLGLRRSQPPPVPLKDFVTPIRHPNFTNPYLPSHDSSPSPALPPQNGRVAWLHALAAILAVANCWGLAQAFGLFQAYYTRYYLPNSNPSAIAWIGSTQLALVFGLGVPVGRIVDKGYFRLIFHGGSALVVLGVLVTSWCRTLWSLWLVQGLLTGFGMGMMFCSGTLALMSWFDESKMGAAIGVGASGSSLGGMAYVLLARHFLATKGFPFTMRILAIIVAATMIPPNLIFRMRGQTHKLFKRPSPEKKPHFTWRTFASPAYLLATTGMFFAFLGVYFGFVYIVSFGAEVLHLSDTGAINLLIFMLVANLPGRFVPGLISDRCIGPLNTIIPSAFLTSMILWLWMAGSGGAPNRTFFTIIACSYGFLSAGVLVLYASTVYSFCLDPPKPHDLESSTRPVTTRDTVNERMGLKAGVMSSCIGLACLIGTPIGGALISYRVDRGMDQPYLGAQVFAAACLLVGGSLLLASRICKIGWAARRA